MNKDLFAAANTNNPFTNKEATPFLQTLTRKGLQNNKHSYMKKSIRLIGVLLLLAFTQTLFAQTQTFSTAGTATWVCPTGVTQVQIECWGGGGGGGGTSSSANQYTGGGGAGGGDEAPAELFQQQQPPLITGAPAVYVARALLALASSAAASCSFSKSSMDLNNSEKFP